jgi:hypothetical protein
MELVKKFAIVLVLFTLIFAGCAPAKFVPAEYPKVEFEPTPPYVANLDEIEVPGKPVKILLDENFQMTEDQTKARYIAFAPKEYTKVQAYVLAGKSYKEIAIEQEKLINTYINQINALKELVALEQAKAEQYRQLWVDSENAYRQERHEHRINTMINRATFIGIGALLIAILAL